MDIMCPRCGEPWEIDSIHEEVAERVYEGRTATYASVAREFQSRGCAAFTAYGARCTGLPDKGRAAAASAMYDLLGDDLDGAASMLEDAEHFGLI